MPQKKTVRSRLESLEKQGRIEEFVYDYTLTQYSRATGIDWDEIPVDLRTFATDDEYSDFGQFMWPAVLDEADEIVRLHETGMKEVVLEWAIGTGKSTLSSLLATYFVYRLLCMRNPQKQFGIAPDDFIAVLNMARTGQQAKKIVFSKISARVKHSKWFTRRQYMPDPKVTSELRFPKSVVVLPGNSSQTFALGYNIIVAILDEANFYEDKQGHDNAVEVYDGMQRRVSSRFPSHGLIAAISSSTHDDSFTRRKQAEAAQEEMAGRHTVHFSQKSIADTKPGIGQLQAFEHRGSFYDVPVSLLSEFRRNPDKALRDYMCVASAGDVPYMPPFDWLKETCLKRDDGTLIEQAWDQSAGWPLPSLSAWSTNNDGQRVKDSRPRYVHVDLGLRKDACGIAMACHAGTVDMGVEKRPLIKLDFAARITPAQHGGEIDFAQVRRIIYDLKGRGFNIARVTYDGFASEESIQQLRRKGLTAELLSVDRDMEPYETLKETIYEKRIVWCFYEPLLREISRLQNIKGKRVDHPAGGSKDVADAVAGAVHGAVSGGAGYSVSWIS